MPADDILVVENERVLRVIAIVLDPATPPERAAACADLFARDEPDFAPWCERLRARLGRLYPCQVRLVATQDELRAALPTCSVAVVASLAVGGDELAAGAALRVVQTFGLSPHNIDTAACAARGIKVLTIRRRASIAGAERAIALMLTLAKQLHRLANRISVRELAAIGHPFRPFDRRHTANANFPRISGLRTLNGATLGMIVLGEIGLGETGREVALRAAAFGMPVLYHQRSRLPDGEERELGAHYAPLDELLAASDWVLVASAAGPAANGFLDAARLAQMKPGAMLVNIARADAVDRPALLAALRSGRLGGFALDPLDEAPAGDAELLQFDNVVLSSHLAPQPRAGALDDLAEMLEGLAKELAT